MPLPPRPAHGDHGWDTYLNAVIDAYETRIATVEGRPSGVSVGTTPPASPTAGALWVDTTAVPNAASSALSTKKLAAIQDFTYTTPRTIPAGGFYSLEFNDPALTILKGAAYFAAAGTALDLDVTVNNFRQLVVPDDDAIYDIYCTVYVTCDAADNGKMVGLDISGGDTGDNEGFFPVIGGQVSLTVSSWIAVAKGNGAQPIYPVIDGSLLSVNATVTRIHPLVIVKR